MWPTDRLTDKAGCRVACTRLKTAISIMHINQYQWERMLESTRKYDVKWRWIWREREICCHEQTGRFSKSPCSKLIETVCIVHSPSSLFSRFSHSLAGDTSVEVHVRCFKSRTHDSRTRSEIFLKLWVVFPLLLLPNHPQLDCRVFGLVHCLLLLIDEVKN